MKNIKNDYQILKSLAYAWDAGPIDYIELKNRIELKYGSDYAGSRMANANGRLIETIFEPRFQHLISSKMTTTEEPTIKESVVDMTIPENEYEKWLNSVPIKEVANYQQKKSLLDAYLNSFASYDRNKLIRTMVVNVNNPNYVAFMDLDPDLMTTQQYLIYKDIIKYYDLQNYHNLNKDRKLWEQFQESMQTYENYKAQALMTDEQLSKQQKTYVEQIIDNNNIDKEIVNKEAIDKQETATTEDTIKSNSFLNSSSNDIESESITKVKVSPLANTNETNVEMNSTIEVSNVNPSLINLQNKLAELNHKLDEQKMLTESLMNQQAVQSSSTANNKNNANYNEYLKPLVFNPQTTVINAQSIFGANNQYAPRNTDLIKAHSLVLTNPEIQSRAYVNNIGDLIKQRDEALSRNHNLVNEIIQKQIAYNNQFLGDNQASSSTSTPLSLNKSSINNIAINNNVADSNTRVSLSNIKTHNMNSSNNLFNSNRTTNTNESENKPISLSSMMKRKEPITTNNNLSSMNVAQQVHNSPINQMGQSANLNRIVNQTSLKDNNKPTPVQTVRPYKPNIKNAIKVPTKSYTSNKSNFEPTNASKNNLIKNVNEKVQVTKEQEVVENKSKVAIPSKKIV